MYNFFWWNVSVIKARLDVCACAYVCVLNELLAPFILAAVYEIIISVLFCSFLWTPRSVSAFQSRGGSEWSVTSWPQCVCTHIDTLSLTGPHVHTLGFTWSSWLLCVHRGDTQSPRPIACAVWRREPCFCLSPWRPGMSSFLLHVPSQRRAVCCVRDAVVSEQVFGALDPFHLDTRSGGSWKHGRKRRGKNVAGFCQEIYTGFFLSFKSLKYALQKFDSK